ncbi:hypothetical protein GGG16DRAFT_95499 [Schizophyllum commune]
MIPTMFVVLTTVFSAGQPPCFCCTCNPPLHLLREPMTTPHDLLRPMIMPNPNPFVKLLYHSAVRCPSPPCTLSIFD